MMCFVQFVGVSSGALVNPPMRGRDIAEMNKSIGLV